MKIYFAGEGYEDVQSKYKANVLCSFFYLNYKRRRINLKQKYKWNRLFIDSGAFSAWSQGVKISIDQYIYYIKQGYADHYAVLDVIGDAEGTLNNQKYMESKGVKPLPCFHYGEDWKYLDYYCKNYDYICLGGMVPISTPELSKWLDVVFAKYPKQKFHGFGLTSTKLVKDYPWHSVDSSTWIVHMKFNELNHYTLGILYLGKTKKDFLEIIKNPANKKWKEKIESYNLKPEELFDDYRLRTDFNLRGFQDLQNYVNEKQPWKQRCYQDVLDVKLEPIKSIPKMNKPKHSVQMSLKNLNLGRKTKVTVRYFNCLECEKTTLWNGQQKQCECGSTTTSIIEKEEWK